MVLPPPLGLDDSRPTPWLDACLGADVFRRWEAQRGRTIDLLPMGAGSPPLRGCSESQQDRLDGLRIELARPKRSDPNYRQFVSAFFASVLRGGLAVRTRRSFLVDEATGEVCDEDEVEGRCPGCLETTRAGGCLQCGKPNSAVELFEPRGVQGRPVRRESFVIDGLDLRRMAGQLRRRFRDPNMPVSPRLLALVWNVLDAGALEVLPLTRPAGHGRWTYDARAESLPAAIYRSHGLAPGHQWTSTRGPHVFTGPDTAADMILGHSALLIAAGNPFAQPVCYSMVHGAPGARKPSLPTGADEGPGALSCDLRRLAMVAGGWPGQHGADDIDTTRALLLRRFGQLFEDRARLRKLPETPSWRHLPLEQFEREACLAYAPHRFDLAQVVGHLDKLLVVLSKESQRGVAASDGGAIRTIDAGLVLWSELAAPVMPGLGRALKKQLLEDRHVDRYLRYAELIDIDRRPELHVEPLFMLPH